jgi:hypothetical protein
MIPTVIEALVISQSKVVSSSGSGLKDTTLGKLIRKRDTSNNHYLPSLFHYKASLLSNSSSKIIFYN